MNILTDRLILRRFAAGDKADLYAYLSDPQVVQYEPYPPLTAEQCGEQLERMMRSPDFWAVCLQDHGKPIGQVYLSEKEQGNWELGYVFHGRYQHHGYACEAVKALVSHVFLNKHAHRIYANCNPDNAPSWRLLERLHFRQEGRLKENIFFRTNDDGNPAWQDTFLYAVLRAEWE